MFGKCLPLMLRQTVARVCSLRHLATTCAAHRNTTICDLGPDGMVPDEWFEAFMVHRRTTAQAESLMQNCTRDLFTSQHDLFRSATRHFYEKDVVPFHEQWEKDGHVSRECWRKAGHLGLLGLDIPMDDYPGDFLDSVVSIEEQAYANASGPGFIAHSEVVMPLIYYNGTEEQRKKYIEAMYLGKTIGAIALSEKEFESDLQTTQTHGRRYGTDWLLNGEKYYVANGHLCDVVIVLAITDLRVKSVAHGLTLFMVDADTKGFTKGPILEKIGLQAQDYVKMKFNNVCLPESAVLGRVNKGFLQLLLQLPQERLCSGIYSMARSEWMFETTRQYIKEKKHNGEPLASLTTVRHKMAELKTEICVTRAFVDQCIVSHTQETLNSFTASMIMYRCNELASRISRECLQIHGLDGARSDSPIAKAYVDTKVLSQYGGGTEAMKELVGRNILS